MSDIVCLNYYGPYQNRDLFWDAAVEGGIFNHPNLIIAVDLNFTLSDADIWGWNARLDPLESYFSQLLVHNRMVNLSPGCAGPT